MLRGDTNDDEIKEQEKKLEELHQMRHALQHNAKEAYEAVYGKTDEAAEVKHTTVEEMEKEGWICDGQVRKSDDPLSLNKEREYYWFARFQKINR